MTNGPLSITQGDEEGSNLIKRYRLEFNRVLTITIVLTSRVVSLYCVSVMRTRDGQSLYRK